MKMKMIYMLSLALIAPCIAAPNTDAAENWINVMPSKLAEVPPIKIAQENFQEIVASKSSTAIRRDLHNNPALKIDVATAQWYVGRKLIIPEGKTPFLIRASYIHGGTGKFFVCRKGDAIVVTHHSLGEKVQPTKTALVVYLDFTPREIFIEAYSAK